MAFFKKKPDPISDRSQVLMAEIAALEAQIKELSAQSEQAPEPLRIRSTAVPHGVAALPATEPSAPRASVRDPIFEPIDQRKIAGGLDHEGTPEHYNDLGVRKYDLASAWRRVRNHFHGPSTHNPKLVSYLAAGTINGLRPLRYEKRVARNRFLGVFLLLVLVLLGFVSVFVRHR